MKMERVWFQLSIRAVIFLSFVVILTGCAKVTVQSAPSEANITPPTGTCYTAPDNHCMKPTSGTCTCYR